MQFVGKLGGFELKFRSISQDYDRYTTALVDMDDAGTLPKVAGQSLYQSYCADGFNWIVDCYFERGLYNEVETYFSPGGEVQYRPWSAYERKILDRLLELGQSARVGRFWLAHLGQLKGEFWSIIAVRKKGFQYEPLILNVDEKAQEASHNAYLERMPQMKALLLAEMAAYRDTCIRTGATAAELARIDADIAAVEAEERPRPKGKTDKRRMTDHVFWELIGEGLDHLSIGERERLETFPERLALFTPAAIRGFELILRQKDAAAYRTDVWALAYLLRGGCSDDSFEAFRGWLILQGRAVFEATLENPDSFDVARYTGDAGGMDALRDAAPQAYQLREGKRMKPVKGPLLELTGPNLQEDQLVVHLPRAASAVDHS